MAERNTKVVLTAQVSNYLANMEKARKATSDTGKAAEDAAAKFAEQNQAMSTVGAGMAASGAIAMAATAIAVKAAIDWETAWAGVTKTVEGTPAQLEEMEQGLRDLAKELPATHEELAAVAEAAGQLGVAREGVLDFTRTMVDLANTTNLTADEAATAIAQMMNVMQTAPEDVDNLGAALVSLGNNGASTEREIILMAQRIAGAGAVIGLTEAEVLGFANALASVGINAEAGGSSISKIMTDIAMAVSEGGEDLRMFAEVAGMSSEDFSVAFKDAPAEAIATFIEGLGGINAAGGDVFKTLSDLGQSDIRTSQALLGMANSGDMLRESLDLGSKSWDENTALAAEAEKRYETTASKLQVMSNEVADAAITYGDVFLPAVQGVSEAVGNLATGFGDLPKPLQETTAILATLAATVALGGGAFLLAIPKIAEYRLALGVLSTSSIPAVAAATTGLMTATSKAATGLAATARFLTGPWGVALAAAGVSAAVFSRILENMRSTSAEMENALTTASKAAVILNAATKGQEWTSFRDMSAVMEDLSGELDKIANQSEDFFSTFGDYGIRASKNSIGKIGDDLAALASKDLPAAQKAFSLLVAETDGSDRQLNALLNTMPAFKEALIAQATELDIQTEGLTESEKSAVLLKIAQDKLTPTTKTAAGAYKEAADQAESLDSQLRTLLETVLEANGIGQDAVSANNDYASALFEVDEYVRQAKEGVEGFTLGWEQNTQAGRDNEQMLVDLAQDSQAAADAQFALDGNTANYKATLEAGRDAVIERAEALGATKDEAILLADAIYVMPSEKQFTLISNLATANAQLQRFKDLVASIDGATLRGPGVEVPIGGSPVDPYRVPKADGGAILGAGGPRSDSIPAWLSNGEHVLDAEDVKRMGGQAAVYRLRNSLYMADGGAVGYRSSPVYGTHAGSSSVTNNEGNRSLNAPITVVTPDPYLAATIMQNRLENRLRGL